jgi:hypothetical protein
VRIILSKILIIFILLSFPSFISADVVINEILPNPSTGSDWVELYSDADSDISGWILDDEGTTTDIYTVPSGESVGPSSNNFYIIDSGTRLNKSGDTIYLYNSSRSEIDSYQYSGYLGDDISFGRYPDGMVDQMKCTPTKGSANSGCSDINIEPTNIADPTDTPTPSKATYKINDVKDEDGNILSSVKIYIDGNYVHHYAPEIIEFCDGCGCDGYASCGFGSHEVMLEKSGFEDWSESVNFNSGDNIEVDPRMDSISTPTNTPKLTSIPTKTPSLKPAKKETSKNKDDQKVTFTNDGNILGTSDDIFELREQMNSSSDDVEENENQESGIFPVAAGLLIAGGLSFIGAASYPFWKKNKLIRRKLRSVSSLLRK